MKKEVKLTEGTPSTLDQAIINGILTNGKSNDLVSELSDSIRNHVLEFLAQRFSVAAHRSTDKNAVFDLWKRIKDKEL